MIIKYRTRLIVLLNLYETSDEPVSFWLVMIMGLVPVRQICRTWEQSFFSYRKIRPIRENAPQDTHAAHKAEVAGRQLRGSARVRKPTLYLENSIRNTRVL